MEMKKNEKIVKGRKAVENYTSHVMFTEKIFTPFLLYGLITSLELCAQENKLIPCQCVMQLHLHRGLFDVRRSICMNPSDGCC